MASQIVLGLLILLALLLITAPLETLSWWSQQDESQPMSDAVPTGPAAEEGTCWVVYLSGIGAVSGESPKPEQPLLQRLRARFGDDAVLVDGVYPYSVLDHGLTEGRDGSWFWRQMERLQNRRFPILPWAINTYNMLQVWVSADRRYGPMFSLGVARHVWHQLRQAGYRHGSGDPVVLFGWSGGAQICVGAAWFLADLGVPMYMLSLGGVISSDPGLDRIKHLWHIQGTRDHVPMVGQIVFPSRWPWFTDSSFNRARREGRLTTHEIGPWRHSTSPTYLSRRPQSDGVVPVDETVDALATCLVKAGLIAAHDPTAEQLEASDEPPVWNNPGHRKRRLSSD